MGKKVKFSQQILYIPVINDKIIAGGNNGKFRNWQLETG
jgi:predicted ester cyclase